MSIFLLCRPYLCNVSVIFMLYALRDLCCIPVVFPSYVFRTFVIFLSCVCGMSVICLWFSVVFMLYVCGTSVVVCCMSVAHLLDFRL